MRSTLSAFIAILFYLLPPGQAEYLAAAQPGKPEQQILLLEQQWDDAIVKRDVSALERILSDDFILIDANGSVHTKRQLIEEIKTSEAEIEPFSTQDVRVRVYGNTAVTTGHFTQRIKYRGKEYTYRFRYTDLYVKKGGPWQAVSAQSTLLPP